MCVYASQGVCGKQEGGGGGETFTQAKEVPALKREKPSVHGPCGGCGPACPVHELSLVFRVRTAQRALPLLEGGGANNSCCWCVLASLRGVAVA